jgi:hypothetical protein
MGRENIIHEISICHVRGTQNVIADSLSRMFEGYTPEEQPNVTNAILTDSPLAFQDIGELQHQNTELRVIIKCLQRGDVVPNYSLSKGVLRCKASAGRSWKAVVPVTVVPMIFKYIHERSIGGHLGIFKTIQKIRQDFIWKGMDHDIRERVRHCQVCAMSKPAQSHKFGFLASQPAERPMQKIFIDYVGRFPRSKSCNSMLLVCVDAFSKFVWLFPVWEATTATTIAALRKGIFASFSVPEIIVSDNAKCFFRASLGSFVSLWGFNILPPPHITLTPLMLKGSTGIFGRL